MFGILCKGVLFLSEVALWRMKTRRYPTSHQGDMFFLFLKLLLDEELIPPSPAPLPQFNRDILGTKN